MKYLLLLLLLPSCANYQASVASRSVGVSANPSGGKLVYKVEYR